MNTRVLVGDRLAEHMRTLKMTKRSRKIARGLAIGGQRDLAVYMFSQRGHGKNTIIRQNQLESGFNA